MFPTIVTSLRFVRSTVRISDGSVISSAGLFGVPLSRSVVPFWFRSVITRYDRALKTSIRDISSHRLARRLTESNRARSSSALNCRVIFCRSRFAPDVPNCDTAKVARIPTTATMISISTTDAPFCLLSPRFRILIESPGIAVCSAL